MLHIIMTIILTFSLAIFQIAGFALILKVIGFVQQIIQLKQQMEVLMTIIQKVG